MDKGPPSSLELGELLQAGFEKKHCSVCCCNLGFHTAFCDQNLDSKKQKFDLGNGKRLKDEEQAYSLLLKRDFPSYQFEDGKQNKILFTPPHYLHKKMFLKEMSYSEFEKLKVQKPNSISMENIEAEDFEANVFDSFQDFLINFFENQQAKNITVIQGWRRNWTSLQPHPKQGKGEEHDLIIIDGIRKLIILFEVKVSINCLKTVQNAKEQLENQVEYFCKHHGHVLTPQWRIVSVIICQNLPSSFICDDCKLFVLDSKSLSNLKI